MRFESKRNVLVRHNMARILANDGGLGGGITEERLRAIHADLGAGLGANANPDRGSFRAGGRGIKGVPEAVSEGVALLQFDGDAPVGAAKAGAHIIRAIADLAPFRDLNVQVGAVVAAKVLEQVGIKVRFDKMLTEDLAETAKLATKGSSTRLTGLIDHYSAPVQPQANSQISFGRVAENLVEVEKSIQQDVKQRPAMSM